MSEEISGITGSNVAAKHLGRMEGLTTGGAETQELVAMLWDEGPAALEKLAHVPSVDELKHIPTAIQRQQQRDNPHIDATAQNAGCDSLVGFSECDQFRQGWYEGYIGYMILESVVVSKGAGSVASKLNELDAVKYGKQTRIANAVLSTRRTVRGGLTAAREGFRSAVIRTASKTYAVSENAAKNIAAQAKTLGQKVTLSQRLTKLDQESWRYIDDQLSKAQQTRLGQYLTRSSERQLVTDGGTVDVEFWRQLDEAVEGGVISEAAAKNIATKINRRDGDQLERAKSFVQQTDGEGLKLIDDIKSKNPDGDVSNLETFFKLDDSTTFKGVSDWESWRTDIAQAVRKSWDNPSNTQKAVNDYLENLRKIDNSDVAIDGNAESLIKEIVDNPNGFPGTANEVRRVADYVDRNDVKQIDIEPSPPGESFDAIDLRIIKKGDDGNEYVELKRFDSKQRNGADVADKFENSNDKFANSKADDMINWDDDSAKVEIDAKAGFKEDVTVSDIKTDMRLKVKNMHSEIKLDKLEIELPNSMKDDSLKGQINNGEIKWET
jgi:hypothetical protein